MFNYEEKFFVPITTEKHRQARFSRASCFCQQRRLFNVKGQSSFRGICLTGIYAFMDFLLPFPLLVAVFSRPSLLRKSLYLTLGSFTISFRLHYVQR